MLCQEICHRQGTGYPCVMRSKSMKIVVLAGGTSTERDVSLSSGSKIYYALKARGHRAILLDVYLGLESEEPVTEDLFEEEIDWEIGRAHV